MAFKINPYEQSDEVKAAQAALNQANAAKPGAYQSAWTGQMNAAMDKILNREDFKYDLNGDALYQSMKDQYVKNGKLAAQNTMGQAAALTGGYGNSYAQQAGQQAYQGYLQDLNAKVPELYQLAMQAWENKGNNMRQNYAMLADREAQDYGRYGDQYNRWANERDYAAGRYDTERSTDYNRWANNTEMQFNTFKEAQARAQAQVQWYLDKGMQPPADLLQQADLNGQYATDYAGAVNKANADAAAAAAQYQWWLQQQKADGEGDGDGDGEGDNGKGVRIEQEDLPAIAKEMYNRGASQIEVQKALEKAGADSGYANRIASQVNDRLLRR